MDKTSGVIIDPHTGGRANVPTIQFETDDARLLREYKKLLKKYGLREALYCNACFEARLSDGLDAHVTDTQIVFKCRCTLRVYMGPTY